MYMGILVACLIMTLTSFKISYDLQGQLQDEQTARRLCEYSLARYAS